MFSSGISQMAGLIQLARGRLALTSTLPYWKLNLCCGAVSQSVSVTVVSLVLHTLVSSLASCIGFTMSTPAVSLHSLSWFLSDKSVS